MRTWSFTAACFPPALWRPDRRGLVPSRCLERVDTIQVLEQNLKVAVNFQPLAAEEMHSLREQCRTLAADGRLEIF